MTLYDVYRIDSVGFLDRIEEGIEARSEAEAIKQSTRARNGTAYVALSPHIFDSPLDNQGKPYTEPEPEPPKPHRGPNATFDKAEARRLRAEGMTYANIADVLGVHTSQAWRACNAPQRAE